MYRFVGMYQHGLQKAGIVTLSLQTDFAARLDEVKEFAKFLAQMAVGFQVRTVEELENVESPRGLIKVLIEELSKKLGESLLVQDVIVVDVSE